MGAYNVVNPSALSAGQPEDISVVLANFNDYGGCAPAGEKRLYMTRATPVSTKAFMAAWINRPPVRPHPG